MYNIGDDESVHTIVKFPVGNTGYQIAQYFITFGLC